MVTRKSERIKTVPRIDKAGSGACLLFFPEMGAIPGCIAFYEEVGESGEVTMEYYERNTRPIRTDADMEKAERIMSLYQSSHCVDGEKLVLRARIYINDLRRAWRIA